MTEVKEDDKSQDQSNKEEQDIQDAKDKIVKKFQSKWADIVSLVGAGENRGAIKLCQNLLDDTDISSNPSLAVSPALEILKLFGLLYPSSDPLPGSDDYESVHKYVKLYIQYYDQITQAEQLQMDSTGFQTQKYRTLLDKMDQNQPLSGTTPVTVVNTAPQGSCLLYIIQLILNIMAVILVFGAIVEKSYQYIIIAIILWFIARLIRKKGKIF